MRGQERSPRARQAPAKARAGRFLVCLPRLVGFGKSRYMWPKGNLGNSNGTLLQERGGCAAARRRRDIPRRRNPRRHQGSFAVGRELCRRLSGGRRFLICSTSWSTPKICLPISACISKPAPTKPPPRPCWAPARGLPPKVQIPFPPYARNVSPDVSPGSHGRRSAPSPPNSPRRAGTSLRQRHWFRA